MIESPSASAALADGSAPPVHAWRIDDLFPDATAAVTTVWPTGRLILVQATANAADLGRALQREPDLPDARAWAAIRDDRAVVWSISPATRDEALDPLLRRAGVAHVAVLPLRAGPIFAGYPAAVHMYRRGDQPAFTPDEAESLRRRLRTVHAPPRLFVIDANLQPIVNAAGWQQIDERLRSNISLHLRDQFARNTVSLGGHRHVHLNARDTLSAVRYLITRSHPALPDRGPAAVVALQPAVEDWLRLSEEDVTGHEELRRFLPSLAYMRQHATESATLSKIAASVNLSPFHFHRRFGELIGLTPKQFLLECQIADACTMLEEDQVGLADVARRCGFSHQSHFTSRFKQATGVTPTKWKRVKS